MRALKLAPVSWWVLALALVIVGTATANLWLLGAVAVLSVSIAFFGAGESRPGARAALRFYLLLAVVVLAIRVLFRVIFNLGYNPEDTIIIDLPRLAVNLGLGKLEILGPVSAPNLLAGATDGLRLAAVIMAIAMANIMANPKVLLKSMPGALFEIASTISVALNLAPQLVESLQRVRRARRLRGRSAGLAALPSLVIPVLEDTLERSLALAASLDSRGFGRQRAAKHLRLARAASLSATALLGIGAYALLASPESNLLAWLVLAFGTASLFLALWLSSARGQRSVYNKTKLGSADLCLAAASVSLVALAWWPNLLGAAFASWISGGA